MTLANDTVSLAFGNRVRDWTWGGDYTYPVAHPDRMSGVSFVVDLPIHDRNQGEIARSQAAVQAVRRDGSIDQGRRADRRRQRVLRTAEQ